MLDIMRHPSTQLAMAILHGCLLLCFVVYFRFRLRKRSPSTRDWIAFSAGVLGFGMAILCFLANWAERLAKVE